MRLHTFLVEGSPNVLKGSPSFGEGGTQVPVDSQVASLVLQLMLSGPSQYQLSVTVPVKAYTEQPSRLTLYGFRSKSAMHSVQLRGRCQDVWANNVSE